MGEDRQPERVNGAEPEVTYARCIVYTSVNGRDNWHPVKAEEVPDWVKTPKNMGRMLRGEMCMKADEGLAGSNWYKAVRVEGAEGTVH